MWKIQWLFVAALLPCWHFVYKNIYLTLDVTYQLASYTEDYHFQAVCNNIFVYKVYEMVSSW